MTKDILPNHMLSVDVKDMPKFFHKPEFDGNSMMYKKLEMLPIECIVRGYITGNGWASYQKDGTVCSIRLSEGLKESDKLPEPNYTPSTKAEIGDEMLIPDNSHFWPADTYEPEHGQPSFDKQFARDWLKANLGNDWTLPEDIVEKTIDKYLQGYEMLTGERL